MKKNSITPAIPHVAAWLIFFSLMIGFLYRSPGVSSPMSILLSWAFLVFSSVYLFLFYFNTYILIPRFYLERRYIVYGLVVVALLVAVAFVKPFEGLIGEFNRHSNNGPRFPMPPEDGPPGPQPGFGGPPRGGMGKGHTDIVSIVLFLTVWSLSTALCIIRQWRQTESKVIQAEADKANAELSFLKAQINPHFLFNTLNNIYSLAVTGSEHTADSILKLSNIMRYVTDDIREDFVPLENEIACLSDYIDLQRLRLGKKMNVAFTVSGDVSQHQIAPLILMTFVENVFKYGISNHESSGITIKLTAEEEQVLFYCRNRIFESASKLERTGIGIANTRKRLDHLYPGKHSLFISQADGYFTVQLALTA